MDAITEGHDSTKQNQGARARVSVTRNVWWPLRVNPDGSIDPDQVTIAVLTDIRETFKMIKNIAFLFATIFTLGVMLEIAWFMHLPLQWLAPTH